MAKKAEKPDMNEFYHNLTEGIKIYSNSLQKYLANKDAKSALPFDISSVNKTFFEAFASLASEPENLAKKNIELYQKWSSLWFDAARDFVDGEEGGEPSEKKYDRLFREDDWENQPFYKFAKDSYLLYADWLNNLVKDVKNISPKEREKLEFYTSQFLNSISPSNFAFTNPEVLRATIETNGENLLKGLQNLARDIEQGKISQTDMTSFEIGKNLATTKGEVVFENDLLQLIQYKPLTEKVYKTPLLFIPAWINKFYIADLSPHNSLVKWLLEQGYTVFIISWVNPTEKHRDKTFESYIFEGLDCAVEKIRKITGEPKINAMGYCLGGTLLAIYMSYQENAKQQKINAATFLTTLLDFSDSGDISIFIDDEQVKNLEARMSEKGYLDGSEMALTFNMLRANDLIWSFVVNNYLLGKTPFPFDILFWNSDSTRMPAKMHSFYLRNMYLQNKLIKGQLEVRGKKIDLSNIKNPAYFLSTKKDHIAPWKTVYKGASMLANSVFTLADSGHVAGVVNPPSKKGYNHWVAKKLADSAAKWEKNAKEIHGSWWESWDEWNRQFSGEKITAREVKNGIEAAPGSYVKE